MNSETRIIGREYPSHTSTGSPEDRIDSATFVVDHRVMLLLGNGRV